VEETNRKQRMQEAPAIQNSPRGRFCHWHIDTPDTAERVLLKGISLSGSDQATIASATIMGCASHSPSSRHSRNTVFAQEWHLPQQVPTPNWLRSSGIELNPALTAWRIWRSETLWQMQTIIAAPWESGSQDQFVQLRQPQPVNPALMVNLDFTALPEQIFALEARGMPASSARIRARQAVSCIGRLLEGARHRIIFL
jgi:hypothetical protein